MIKLLKSFFSYVPSDPPPEAPEDEPADPNSGKSLSESYRKARRNLVILSAIGIAWSGAQFTITEPSVEIAKVSLQFDSASIPLILAFLLVYLSYRWVFEFAIMEREVRRWPLAQFDFRVVFIITRFSLLAVSAGALQRSLRTVLLLLGMLFLLFLCVIILTALLMLIAMPIRVWARARADRPSVANAAFEAAAWAEIFAIVLTVVGLIGFGVASYQYPPLNSLLWNTPPTPVTFSAFIIVSVGVFLSHWLLRSQVGVLFVERRGYRTYRTEDGSLVYQFGGGLSATCEPIAEQDGADQPATAPESKSEDKDKSKLESEGRPQ